MEFIFELQFELAFRTPGYFIIRMFRPGSKVGIEDNASALAGLLFWGTVGLAIWASMHFWG